MTIMRNQLNRLGMALRVLFAAAVATLFLATGSMSQVATWKQEWPNTDFSKSLVDLAEILSGGVPRDGIPSITDPEFIAVELETVLDGREPVMTLELDGEIARAYPIRYLLWHEIVNDVVGSTPVAITYCPLCNSAVFFDRRVNGALRTFGVSGKLRHSDMVMYDRETESWWQQALGEGIVGVHAGDKLDTLPGWMESWDEFRMRNPGGLVLAQPNHRRRYGTNPYRNYDLASRPFLYSGELPPHGIPALARVVKVGDRAWPLERLRKAEELTEHGIRFSWRSGQASPLDTQIISEGRDIGTIRVRDAETDEDLVHDVMFAFAFHAFFPDDDWILEN